jgi:hypothetical protein
MQTIKNLFLVSVIVIGFLSLYGCEKDDKYEFGDIEMEFKVDSIYQSASDGFLTVQYKINGFGPGIFVKIYSDNIENPSTLVGEIGTASTATLPIKRNNYWKVVKGKLGDVVIGFTPILSNE